MKESDRIALERCRKLLELAADAYDGDKPLSKRYVSLARKIAMRHRLKLGRRKFCKKCGTVFIQGKTVRTRLDSRNKTVLYSCLNCSSTSRIPYSRKKTLS